MKDSDKMDVHEDENDEAVQLYDPFAHHFVSQNKRSAFLKALEEGQGEVVCSTS